ncbi:hypothetical protein BS47DRAFT_1335850 [Hydnum rufescens UP504]|uniref:FYVE-type domain-containing protein n=1 Tax=Hydnum rufescens UP504 TaxID=1448309 RepID=A0A9P6BAB6_9AGAM|nr:hypothetical protein BS47DRAFT_1335850 [Hydnum rufescens UP504]
MQNADNQSNGLTYMPYTSKRHSRNSSTTSDDFHASGSKPLIERGVPPPPAKVPERNDLSSSPGTTFRRLGPRPSQPPAPSPLRPKTTEPASPSVTRVFRPLEPGPSASPHPSQAPLVNDASPAPRPPPKFVPSEPSPSGRSSSPILAVSPAVPTNPLPDPPLIQSNSRPIPPAALESKAMPPLPSSPQPPASSLSPSADFGIRQRIAPYRPGFQPKGVYRHRTDEFVAARNLLTNNRKAEERRIERRLEKLVDLHFPPESIPTPERSRRSSSFFDLSELRVRNPADLLRSVMEPKPGTVAAIRAAEQVITPWQEDSSVSSCPICQSSFHPLSNRKHHCRLCGRVICALPPRKPNRPRQCSLLVTADRRTGHIRPIPETIDYGVSKRSSTSSKSLTDTGPESQPKGIRVCCECNAIIDRKQFIHEAHSSSTFTKLYEAFTRIEGEIESTLGPLEALIPSMELSPTNLEALDLQKRLSVLFTEYDAIAKRIRALPVPTPDGSQERVQQAVWTRAVHFMQSHVGILQRIPKPPMPSKNSKFSRRQGINGESAGDPEKKDFDPDSTLARALQPLLEQEALLETFILEANAQRKFEDVKSLKANLAEIRGEISKVVAASSIRSR